MNPVNPAKSFFWHRIKFLLEPQILFPAITFAILALIWGSTLQLVNTERANAKQAARELTLNLADVYELQVLRALHDIDQTLKIVKYAVERGGEVSTLADLKAKDVLPSDQIFIVSITDRSGVVIASTRAKTATSLSSDSFFQQPPADDTMTVSLPHRNLSGDWVLDFSRRLQSVDGHFAGVVWVTVRADYFVSGYEREKLGDRGVLGLVGTDGVFRVRRSGASIAVGDKVDYPALLATFGQALVGPAVDSWDRVRRYTSVQPLYGYPLAVVVGVAEADQLALVQKPITALLQRAVIVSAGAIIVVLLLWLLVQVRRRAIEERLEHAERVEYLAYHDGLTGLPNRRLLGKLQSQAIAQARRYNHSAAIVFLDLDGFKRINDTLGHDAGDLLLQDVAQRLKSCLRQSDTVARLGGDEFVVLLPEADGEGYVVAVAQKILLAIAQPYTLFGQDYRVTASIGISIFPNDGLDEQTLAKNADVAMYRAKEQGKNNIQLFSTKSA